MSPNAPQRLAAHGQATGGSPGPAIYAPGDDAFGVASNSQDNYAIVHESPEISGLIERARQFAPTSASILISGESGTGKELFCRLIHLHSGRMPQRFVAVNCAAIPELLAESEFFGHRRGAFTGALEQRVGHFEQADGGTILLDEISEIPLSIQAKLLRVLEEREIQRVGSNKRQKIDVRVIATSNRDLKNEVAKGRFRLDLYHRLNVLELRIPPLRERPLDIPCLANHFIDCFKDEATQKIKGITELAMTVLQNHSWLGNVRELRNVIHRACILCRDQLITQTSLGDFEDCRPTGPADLRGMKLVDVERTLILEGLDRLDGNKNSVALELGITTRTLNNKLRNYRDCDAGNLI